MENLETIKAAGDVLIEEISLLKGNIVYDIRTFAANVVIQEDIFSNVLTGYSVFIDAASMITQFGINGTEKIRIKYRTPGFRQTIEGTFQITSIDERFLGEKEQIYVVHFISLEGFLDNSVRLNKKYSGRTDRIIRDIFNENLFIEKELIVSESHNTSLSFLPAFWSPLKCINWVTNRSYKTTPGILFFEGNKKFYLTSLDKLIRLGNNNIYQSYVYSAAGRSNDDSIEKRYAFIQQLNLINYFDVLQAQDYGFYASKLVTHDIALKQYKEFSFDGLEYHRRKEHTDTFPTYPIDIIRNPESHIHVRTKQYGLFENNQDPKYEVWAMQRNHIMYEMNNLKISIKVSGKTDIEVGSMINISIPKSIAHSDNYDMEASFDPYLSGKYLITNIRHEFAMSKHTMDLECVKESFSEPIK